MNWTQANALRTKRESQAMNVLKNTTKFLTLFDIKGNYCFDFAEQLFWIARNNEIIWNLSLSIKNWGLDSWNRKSRQFSGRFLNVSSTWADIFVRLANYLQKALLKYKLALNGKTWFFLENIFCINSSADQFYFNTYPESSSFQMMRIRKTPTFLADKRSIFFEKINSIKWKISCEKK